ncbi:hypothetical protein [Corallococcus sp. Z5C101001]|uniref:hypothetical protein n=1 Tax=Corallococcus sp. Z5C101001 TaxID=2596829 RepID=UPI00117BF3A8|nr:hypothetical protein [Corallococcus sp. Z5C101001]TSC24105.1 hypothetical protein FOF48_28355 [Corallococcus sp. Z5C101001]
MRALSSALHALVAASLLSGCGPEQPSVPAVPSFEEVERVCAGVHCTAGYCTSAGGVATCRCGPVDEEAGSVCEVDEEGDFDDLPTPGPQMRSLPVGPESGWLHRGDTDRFTFAGEAGRTYRFTCIPEAFQWCDLAISPWFGAPYEPARVSYEGRATVLTLTLYTASLRTAELAAWPGGYSFDRGAYTFSLLEVEDPEGTLEQHAASVSTDGTPITGRIDFHGDTDAFAFTTLEQHVYRAHCTGPELVADIRAAGGWGTGQKLQRDEDGGRTAEVKLPAGSYLLWVGTAALSDTADYQCTLQDLGADDHGDDSAHATPLATFDTALTGVLGTRFDLDWFSFPAKAGHAYNLACDSAAPSGCGAASIRFPDRELGQPVVVSQDGLLRAYVYNTPRKEAGPHAPVPYTFKVVDLGADQGTGVADAVPASVGVPIPVYFASFTDRDYFRVDVEAGHVYRLAFAPQVSSGLFGAFRPAEPATNLMRAFSATQGLFKSDRSEPIVFQVGLDVVVNESPYVLRIDDLGPDDHGDTREAATTVPGPSLRADGVLDTWDDVDWFALELEPRAYAVRSLRANSNPPIFTLFEADGVTPVPDSGSGNVRPRVAGRHYLRVNPWLSGSNDRSPYRWELNPR